MRKNRARAAALLLVAVLPLRLLPADAIRTTLANGPARIFSLAATGVRSLPATPAPSVPATSGQPTAQAPERYTFRILARDFLYDAGRIWGYPVHIKKRDILPIAGLAALTGFLIVNDEAIYRGFRTYRDNHAWVRHTSPVITQMGSWGAYGTVGLFLGFGLITGDKKSTETAVLASNAMLQSAILVGFLKGAFGRQRPEAADGVDHWSGPVGLIKMFKRGETGRYDSFPSGHTITAFSLATVVAMQYRDTVWVPILSYTVATGVGLSRPMLDKHWLSDVVVGGVLGHLVGRLVVNDHRRRYHLLPSVGRDHGSFSFAFTFAR
jgi:membrane-associated phospholipid phosphatase